MRKTEMKMTERVCSMCGEKFFGTGRAVYCIDCKVTKREEDNKKYRSSAYKKNKI